jgi:hypothetical protein
MLRHAALALLLTASLPAAACWRMSGTFAVDGESWKFDSKVEHNREYIFPAGTFILKLTLRPQDKKRTTLAYVVHERQEKELVLVTKGEESDVESGKVRDIYAKGASQRPNSIITVKLTDI